MMLISLNSFGETVLRKGSPAPENGLFFDQKSAQVIQRQVMDDDNQKALVQSLQTTIKLYSDNQADDAKKIQLLSDQNDRLVKNDASDRSVSTIEKAAWFVLGLAVMGVAVGVGKQISK